MKLTDIFGKIASFFKEVKIEIKKVNWPTKRETIRYTLIVLTIAFFVALYLGLLDLIFTTLLKKFIL
ncbi:MAG: preprotein translocase subunit SecE [Minisyncoccales bacterium]